MFRRLVALATLVALAAAPTPAPLSPKPQGAEVTFLKGIQKDLNARFATPADAEKAGYFRYTDEDDTGAISYTNLQWQSSDPQHPSQLWYSPKGKLLGADYSVLISNQPTKPMNLWGLQQGRWAKFGAHIHYVLTTPSGQEKYGYSRVAKFKAAGGDVDNPQADTLVKLGATKDAASVKHVFLFPQIWDVTVWVMDNPAGAFNDKNPLVHPSANATSM